MQDHLQELAKLTSKDNPVIHDVKLCANTVLRIDIRVVFTKWFGLQLTKLNLWMDAESSHNTELVKFQARIPLADVTVVSESRKMLRYDDVSKVLKGKCTSLKPIHIVLLTYCFVMCSIRQNLDPAVSCLYGCWWL